MECLVQIAFYRFAVSADGLPHGRGRRSWRREQGLDKPLGLDRIKLNLFALGNNSLSHFTRMRGDESGERAAFNSGSSLKKPFVRRGHPGDKAVAFRFFQCCRHALNVCLSGTQIKNGFCWFHKRV